MATLQHPLSIVAAKHKSGHSRVNRCGLMGLASRDFPNEFKKSAACIFFFFFFAASSVKAVLFVEKR